MKTDSVLRLSDKTVVISAPFSILACSLLTTLTAHGADCAIICKEASEARRFCENLSDAREADETHGRAAAFEADMSVPLQSLDAISKSAETFGGVDIFIDANFVGINEHFQNFDFQKNGETLLRQTMLSTLITTQGALKFLEGRNRGRLIYLLQDESTLSLPGESLNAFIRSGLVQFARTLSREMSAKHVQINCLNVGLTEEYLLKRFPKSPTIKIALEEFHKIVPGAKIQDPTDVANAVAFLASPLSSAFPGKTF